MRCRKQYVLFVQKRVKRYANEWVGEGRFITFYFIIFYTISFFIYKKKYESYKSTLTIPHL